MKDEMYAEDPFKGKPLKRAVTGPGRYINTASAKAMRGVKGLEESRKKDPKKYLTEGEEEYLQSPGFLSSMLDKKKKK